MPSPQPPQIEAAPYKSDWNGIGNEHHLYRFANGYGASVVRGPYTYGGPDGLWEMAVIKFDGNEWELCYETPVTDDVIGYLSDEALAEKLIEVAAVRGE